MIKVKKAIMISKLDLDLQDVLNKIKKHEGIINSVKVEANVKSLSKTMLKWLIQERKRLSDQITEAIFLDD